MAEKLSIKITIGNRIYPMTIGWDEEESIRKAVAEIETKIKDFEQRYAVKDKQDVLAMCALQYAVKLIEKDNKTVVADDGLVEKLEDIESFLAGYLSNK